MTKTTNTKKKTFIKRAMIGGGVFVIIVLGIAVALVYSSQSSNVLTRVAKHVLPLPAAVIDWTHIVSIASLEKNVAATRNFYENQDFASIGVRIDFTTTEGQQKLKLWEHTLLDKLIEDKIVYILAKRVGIEITDAQVHARVKQELDRYGKGRLIQKNIYNLWGFTLKDFEERIVKPQLYREALETYARKQYDITSMRQRALEAHLAIDRGMDFADAVQKYSDGVHADQSGNAGWFAFNDLLPEIAEKVFALATGAYSDVIETANAFHIIKVEDRRTGSEGDQVFLRHIIIFKPSFAQWLDDKIKAFHVFVLLPAYTWNTETRHVDITDPKLLHFAEEILKEADAQQKVLQKTAQENAQKTTQENTEH